MLALSVICCLLSLVSSDTIIPAMNAKQKATLSSATPAQRSSMKKSLAGPAQPKAKGRPDRRARNGRRAPVAQIPRPLATSQAGGRHASRAFNAFDKFHLPLDEVTAPYAVTDFMGVMEFESSVTIDQVVVICPRVYNQEVSTGPLTDYIAIRYDASETLTGPISSLETLRAPIIDAPAVKDTWQYTSVRARLHNLSAKLECMGTNTGLYPPGSAWLGTVPCIEPGPTSVGASEVTLTLKQAWAEDSIAVGYLKSTSAAALVDKPAFVHAAIAENVSYKTWRDLSVPPSSTVVGSMPFSTAMEPIVIYIPKCGAGTTVVNYRLTVAQQWCSRHPHNIMIRSTQKQHPATKPDLWNKVVSSVKNAGPQLAENAAHGLLNYLTRSMAPPRGVAIEDGVVLPM